MVIMFLRDTAKKYNVNYTHVNNTHVNHTHVIHTHVIHTHVNNTRVNNTYLIIMLIIRMLIIHGYDGTTSVAGTRRDVPSFSNNSLLTMS
jgi:hypothetical protein